MKVDISLNGQAKTLEVEKGTPLLWVIRDEVGLTGTKFGCGDGICGACTVIMDGLPIFSCDTPIWSADGKNIETIEGLSVNGIHPLQEEMIDEQAGQCGYCLSGITMRIKALLDKNPNQNVDEIAEQLDRNLCRCGSQSRILKAVENYIEKVS